MSWEEEKEEEEEEESEKLNHQQEEGEEICSVDLITYTDSNNGRNWRRQPYPQQDQEGNENEESQIDLCYRHGNQVLVVGNCCHDILFLDGRILGESLGGAVSFVSNVFDAFFGSSKSSFSPPVPSSSSSSSSSSYSIYYVSMVGYDFRYHQQLSFTPSSSSSIPTTLFHAHFSSRYSCPDTTSFRNDCSADGYHADRVLRRIAVCDQILPSDLILPSFQSMYDFGLAVGVAGEICPKTLARMIDICSVVLVDAQALIRTFDDTSDGTVRLVPLRDSGFYHLLPHIAFLKASADEAPFLNVEESRKLCCVIVTDGKEGCTLYWKEGGELHVPAFPASKPIDPTGAGDSFFAGFAAGLMHGLTVLDAALLGNFFGSLTVRQIGVPKFQRSVMKAVKGEMKRKVAFQESKCVSTVCHSAKNFGKSEGHEEFMKFLANEVDK